MSRIKTPCGEIRGTTGRVPGTIAYKGIRYATADRWEYPRQVTSWEGAYDATQYGHCCYQPRSFYNEEENLKKVFYYSSLLKSLCPHFRCFALSTVGIVNMWRANLADVGVRIIAVLNAIQAFNVNNKTARNI